MPTPKNVLLIDDDDPIRKLCGRILQSMGIECLQATTAQTGLALLSEHPDCDAVILDLNLPDESGQEIAPFIQKTYPDIPLIYFTGGTAPETDENTFVLPKPFTKQSLKEVLSEACSHEREFHRE